MGGRSENEAGVGGGDGYCDWAADVPSVTNHEGSPVGLGAEVAGVTR